MQVLILQQSDIKNNTGVVISTLNVKKGKKNANGSTTR